MRTESELRLQTNPDQKTKVIPNQEQLAQLDRDLQFYPSRTIDPLYLTSEQIEDFNQYGYLTGIQIFSDDEILVYRHHFDALLTEVSGPVRLSPRIYHRISQCNDISLHRPL